MSQNWCRKIAKSSICFFLKPYLLLSILALIASGSIAAENLPSNSFPNSSFPNNSFPNKFSTEYTLSKSGVSIAEVKGKFSLSNSKYNYTFESKTIGIASWLSSDKIKETSSGSYSEEGFSPETYTYSRTGGDKDKETSITYNREKNTADENINGERKEIQIEKDSIDRLIVQLAIMNYCNNNPDIEKKSFTITDKHSLKAYTFKKVKTEKIETEIGKYNTLVLNRTREGSSRSTTLWLAKELNYLPVKIIQKKDGEKKFTMKITTLEGMKTTEKKSPKDDSGWF